MTIMHNMLALNADRMQGIKEKRMAKTVKKLSSGYKINTASDNAAGLSISEKMRFQIRGLNRGADNIQEGIGYCQVADGALNEIHDMLQRMNELSIQAANGTNSYADRECIDDELQTLKEEIDRICITTKYNEEYIFRCEDPKEAEDSVVRKYEVYDLTFSGYPDDLFIYNETYDAATGETTYGGVAYKGRRYSWDGISPGMYDKDTRMFRAGTYSLKADDGSWLTLICENGSRPPQVSREFVTSADAKGIYVNGELIKWEDVKSSSGNTLGAGKVTNEAYSFDYHGVICSFTPKATDSFEDVISKISGTVWRSKYKIPTEDTALYADFGDSFWNFLSNDEVKAYLEGLGPIYKYILRAGEIKDGVEGIWVEFEDNNGVSKVVDGSFKSLDELKIDDWGDQSTDIWSSKEYVYEFFDTTGNRGFEFKFNVINEISKDSLIDALDGIDLSQWLTPKLSNHAKLENKDTSGHVSRAEITFNYIDHSVEEEYKLGRDYGNDNNSTVISDEYGNEGGDRTLKYDNTSDEISIEYKYDDSRVAKGSKRYSMYAEQLVENIKNQIKQNTKDYIALIRARYLAGVKNPENTNLAELISPDNITGGGSSTYLEDVFTFNSADSTLKSTLSIYGEESFAGGKIDFSGLGTAYGLADLLGMGFNSTCQTCNNHYSVQFTNKNITNTSWQDVTVGGKTYRYSLERSGNNWNLFIDMDSMEAAGIDNGNSFTNALVDIFDASGFDSHYTQYATREGEAALYVFDNRPEYAGGGKSTATKAAFSPYAYDSSNLAKFDVNLVDDDLHGNIRINYEYNYEDLFKNLEYTYTESPTGEYVKAADDKYEKYDPAKHGSGVTRYDLDAINLNLGTYTNEDEYLENYIRTQVLPEVAAASSLSFVSDYAGYRITADENPNKAMVTEYNTPYQIKPAQKQQYNQGEKEETEYLKIQCSSNTIDNIYILKQKLSIYRMGLENLSSQTEKQATEAIELVENALSKVNAIRSKFGAFQNRLEHAYAINRNTHENTQNAESVIRDTDMAEEMIENSNNSILLQAGFSILAQANQNSSLILNLIS